VLLWAVKGRGSVKTVSMRFRMVDENQKKATMGRPLEMKQKMARDRGLWNSYSFGLSEKGKKAGRDVRDRMHSDLELDALKGREEGTSVADARSLSLVQKNRRTPSKNRWEVNLGKRGRVQTRLARDVEDWGELNEGVSASSRLRLRTNSRRGNRGGVDRSTKADSGLTLQKS